MKENCRSPKSVPKIRREPSPQYVSDRLRRARNCSNERRDDSTIRSFEYIRSTDPIRISPRCTVESERHPQSHSKRSRMGESTHSNQLPERVLKLVVSPCKKENGHCSSQKFCDGKDDLNIIGIYMKVLEELKQEINSLEGGNLNGKTPISTFIDECFHTTNSRSSVIDGNQLSGYTRTLAVECVDIIERVVLQQNEIISELNNESKLSPKKKIKTLLLNVMLGIEHELILSEKILEIVETDLHHSSFQFIYCLLKHFVEKIAVHLKTSSGSNLGLSHLDEPSVDWRVQHALSRASISNCKIEEYSNRLDNLLKQWSGTGDTLPKIDTSQQVVIDCYHCLSDKKERDLLLKTVTRFTEEIQRKLIECHGGEKIARLPKNSATEKISEASKIEEPSANDTGCSTEMSTYNSWTVSNRPRLNNRRILSQYSNQADPSSLRNRNSYQDSVKEGRNTRNLSPPLAQSSIKASNYSSIASGRNYFSKTQSSVVSNNRGMPPSIIDRSIHHDKYPPLLDDTEHFRGKSPTKREGNNYHNSLYTQEGNANKLISAPSFADNRRHNMAPFSPDVNNYQGRSPSMSSSANGRNYHTKPSTSLTDDTLVSYLQQSKKEIRNHHTKFPYIAAKEENKLVTAPYNPNDINHHNKNPIMTGDDTYRGNSTVCAERRWSISMDYPKTRPSTDVGKYYQNIPPPRNDVNYNSMPPNMSNNNVVPPPQPQIPNVCTIPPPMTLKPFPKLQLPTFDPCRTVDSRCYCNVPRCMSQVPSNQGCNLFSKGKNCLIICEDKPKPPYFDGYPGFNGAGFYGNGYDYSFQPQMLNTFPVSTQPKNEKKIKTLKKTRTRKEKSPRRKVYRRQSQMEKVYLTSAQH
ncbi:hypothetical protein GE061_015155 [Apolygus lucorum]|uniref:Uncharacterized protein n=1 Tax=Apolygus lucorum TaxID=248454 RepID=A0A8S9XMD1_APOLU|nr:hypothetical protein GE061_015155 [Apolygus lucorum]